MKRYVWIAILLSIILSAFVFWEFSSTIIDYNKRTFEKGYTPFIDKEVIKRQEIYEGKYVRAFYNYKPLLKGHTLIIPKRHVERFENLTDDELVEMKKIIQKMQKAFENVYNKSDYVLVLQNGFFAGQTVPHVHFHMIPRGNESLYLLKLKLWQQFLLEPLFLRRPLSDGELQIEIQPLKDALSR